MKKALMLALAAASVMMFALPAVASAESWNIDWNNGDHKKALPFTVAGSEPKLKTHTGDVVECSSVGGSGSYSTTTTGSIHLSFTGCRDAGTGVTCTSSGSASGTITTTALTFHNIYVTHAGTKGAAVLITPNAGHFATFDCKIFGFGPTVKVGGTGVIGTVESCEPGKSFGINFQESAPGTQTHTTPTNTLGHYDLTSSRDGAAPVTASQVGTGTVSFTQTVTPTCVV
jgi:hypothetical protein